ncbi:hypothetical protein DL98DRAFT_509273 [Cadophora sp. DSE1049]|nr:hypothetical protein DL98DRAFT_509273 [Cadophora sp. DSE1049]
MGIKATSAPAQETLLGRGIKLLIKSARLQIPKCCDSPPLWNQSIDFRNAHYMCNKGSLTKPDVSGPIGDINMDRKIGQIGSNINKSWTCRQALEHPQDLVLVFIPLRLAARQILVNKVEVSSINEKKETLFEESQEVSLQISLESVFNGGGLVEKGESQHEWYASR